MASQTFSMLFQGGQPTHSPTPSSFASTAELMPMMIHIILLLSIIPPLYYLHSDYKAFTSLGPGGTPSTPLGYLRIKILSLFALKNPYQPDTIHPHLNPGVLDQLPARTGPRPRVAGIAPHRQVDQRAGKELFTKLSEGLRNLASQQCDKLAQGTSCFEKHGTGLFCLAPLVRTCRGEICHVHPSDGSMHLSLHPADAKVLLEAGWGERHPLARGGWFRRFVPREFVMVYAPRNEEDIETVLKIVCAAAWWVGGSKLDPCGRELDPGHAAAEADNAPPVICRCGASRISVTSLVKDC